MTWAGCQTTKKEKAPRSQQSTNIPDLGSGDVHGSTENGSPQLHAPITPLPHITGTVNAAHSSHFCSSLPQVLSTCKFRPQDSVICRLCFAFWEAQCNPVTLHTQTTAQSVHPPLSPCATSAFESFMNFQLPITTSPNSCDSLSWRWGRMPAPSSCHSYQSRELRHLPSPGVIFPLVSKQCVKPCRSSSLSEFKDD